MPSTDLGLTELENDALTEMVNLGVSRAATSLSRMLGAPVQLSVPRTEILPLVAAAASLAFRERTSLVAVSQRFSGTFSGQALLLFPEANSLELVRAAIGSSISIEEVADLEQEALTEIGNIILNGCLVVIANTLKREFRISLPHLLRGSGREILIRGREIDPDEVVLFLHVDFSVHSGSVHGYIALLMDLPSLAVLRSLIREFIVGLGDQDSSTV